jgi:PAS domain S-box-containing protein
VIDDRGIIQSANPAAELLFGDSESELAGRNVRMLMPPALAAEHDGYIAKYLETGEKHIIGVGREVVGRRRDGVEVPLQLYVSEMKRGGKRLFTGVMHDISIRKQAEREAADARALAEQAAASQGRFLANMSHEIRTPMNGVLGMLDLLLLGQLPPDERGYVKIAHQSALSLLAVIDDILDISKIRAGRLELERIPFDLDKIIEETSSIAAALAGDKELRLTCYIAAQVPWRVNSDPARLRQVLLNLLGNAVKFTERGEIELTVDADRPHGGRAAVNFSVRDTGIGIEQDRLDSLFDPFTQADVSITRRYGGTGLGLAITKQLVNLMGGEVSAESAPGRGSTFHFTATFDVIEAVRPVGAQPQLEAGRVLIVDDSPAECSNLQRYLTEWGASDVECIAEPAAALERLRGAEEGGQPYRLVLLKHPLPQGERLAAALEPMQDTHLIVMLPVNVPSRNLHYPGCASFLVRPVYRSGLESVLRTVQGQHPGEAAPRADRGADHSERSGREAVDSVRVLLVEDRPINQRVCMEMLRWLNVSVTLAEDGQQALDRARNEAFDLILMDGQMPVMDGFTAARGIRAWELESGARHTPIVALTAQSMAGDREACLEAGMDDYLSKPFMLKDLQRVLFSWVPGWAPAAESGSD